MRDECAGDLYRALNSKVEHLDAYLAWRRRYARCLCNATLENPKFSVLGCASAAVQDLVPLSNSL